MGPGRKKGKQVVAQDPEATGFNEKKRLQRQFDKEELLQDEIDEFHSHKDMIDLESSKSHGHEDVHTFYDDDIDPVLDIQTKHDEEEEDEEAAPLESDSNESEDDSDVGELTAKNWGSKRAVFYDTDHVDPDWGQDSEDEREAEEEEKEVERLEKKQFDNLTNEDFGLLLPQSAGPVLETSDTSDTQLLAKLNADLEVAFVSLKEKHAKINKNTEKLSMRQKLEIIAQQTPELLEFCEDFDEKTAELEKLSALIEEIKAKESPFSNDALHFILLRQRLILSYTVNIVYYFYQISKGINTKSHPSLDRLLHLRKFLAISKDIGEQSELFQQISDYLNGETVKMPKQSQTVPVKVTKNATKTVKAIKRQQKHRDEEEEEEEEEHKQRPRQVVYDDDDNEQDIYDASSLSLKNKNGTKEETTQPNEGNLGPRAITKQMMKNRGLVPSRKKEMRNPRVHMRRKFEKSQIRRKSSMPAMRDAKTVYKGETSGIRNTIVRTTKLS